MKFVKQSCNVHSSTLVSLRAVPFVCPSLVVVITGLEIFSPTSLFPLPSSMFLCFFPLIFLLSLLLSLSFSFPPPPAPARLMDMQSMLRSEQYCH